MSLIIINKATGNFLGVAPHINGLREGGAPILFGRDNKASLGLHDPTNPPTSESNGPAANHFALWPATITYGHNVIHVGALEHDEDAQYIPRIQLLADPDRISDLEAELADLKAWRDGVAQEIAALGSGGSAPVAAAVVPISEPQPVATNASEVPVPAIAPLSNAGPSESNAPAPAVAEPAATSTSGQADQAPSTAS